MRRLTFLSATMLIAAAAAIMMGITACEKEPSMSDLDAYFKSNPHVNDPRIEVKSSLTLAPATAAISEPGEQIAFRVRGGNKSTYTWDVANRANGTIVRSEKTTDHAVYTATRVAANTVIAYDSHGRAAVAPISDGTSGGLKVVPASITIQEDLGAEYTEIYATGGEPPYQFIGNHHEIGTVRTIDAFGGQGGYTPNAGEIGTVTITVIDANGDSVTASITQL